MASTARSAKRRSMDLRILFWKRRRGGRRAGQNDMRRVIRYNSATVCTVSLVFQGEIEDCDCGGSRNEQGPLVRRGGLSGVGAVPDLLEGAAPGARVRADLPPHRLVVRHARDRSCRASELEA